MLSPPGWRATAVAVENKIMQRERRKGTEEKRPGWVVLLRCNVFALGCRRGQALDYGGLGNGKHGRSTNDAAGKRKIRLGYSFGQ